MVLDYLKKETKELHREVEAVFYGHKIMNGTLNKEEYVDMILKNHYIFHALEKNILEKFNSFFADYEPNLSRHQLLDKDLTYLDVSPLDFEIVLPDYQTPEEILGALYVIEGSMLGGAMIARSLCKNTNLMSVSDYFFYNPKKEIRKNWVDFQYFISNYALSDTNYNVVLKGATETFHFFKKVYRRKQK